LDASNNRKACYAGNPSLITQIVKITEKQVFWKVDKYSLDKNIGISTTCLMENINHSYIPFAYSKKTTT
jgi:hypothetical protein